jgi:hypothetical protein
MACRGPKYCCQDKIFANYERVMRRSLPATIKAYFKVWLWGGLAFMFAGVLLKLPPARLATFFRYLYYIAWPRFVQAKREFCGSVD